MQKTSAELPTRIRDLQSNVNQWESIYYLCYSIIRSVLTKAKNYLRQFSNSVLDVKKGVRFFNKLNIIYLRTIPTETITKPAIEQKKWRERIQDGVGKARHFPSRGKRKKVRLRREMETGDRW